MTVVMSGGTATRQRVDCSLGERKFVGVLALAALTVAIYMMVYAVSQMTGRAFIWGGPLLIVGLGGALYSLIWIIVALVVGDHR